LSWGKEKQSRPPFRILLGGMRGITKKKKSLKWRESREDSNDHQLPLPETCVWGSKMG